ncbi:MAG TPA: ABC transporter permease [Longimicrobiales bacterium]|nr:ABC transporter permease [Longimicrobiales bacterium]
MSAGGSRRLRWPWRTRSEIEAEVDEEIAFHLDMRTRQLVGAGLSSEAARAQALREFGDVAAARASLRASDERGEERRRRREWLAEVRQDGRFSLRALRRNPGFALVAVLTLALGIGANTAIFSVVNGILLRPLPYRSADRLVVAGMSLPDYRDVVERSNVFEATSVWATNIYKLATDSGEPEQVMGAVVSPAFFPMLAAPALGRTFRPEEDRAPLAVISHGLWQRRFGGDRGVLGRTLRLSGDVYTIVGVMPPSFEFPDASFEVWVPLGSAMVKVPEQELNRSLRIFRVLGRLRPGVDMARVRADARAISARLAREHPDTNEGVQLEFEPLYDRVVGAVRPALLILLGAVGFVLLIACANVANLLLARTTARAREMAVRRALGAGRGRLARQLLTESVVLALAGGALGVGLAAWLLRTLPHLGTDLPRLAEVGVDARVLAFAALATLATSVLFGLAPALHGAGEAVAEALKEGGRGAVGGGRGGVLRRGLIVAEIALSMVVLVGAGLLVRSLVRMLDQDVGFQPAGLLTTNVELFHYENPARRAVMLDQVIRRVAALPGVAAVGAGTGLPPRTAQRGTGFLVAGRVPDEVERARAYFLAVTPAYFAAMGAPVLRGRAFRDSDGAGDAPVVIINKTLAARLFPGRDPIGAQLELVDPDQDSTWRTIVGVVPDIRYQGLDDPGDAAIYTPFPQTPFLWANLMVRAHGPPRRLEQALRAAIESVDPQLTPARIEAMEELVSESVAQRRFHTLLLTGFALLATLLAAVGIYGVIAYSVSQRTREIGVRLALGAAPRAVIRSVLREGLGLALAGVAIGLLAALGLTRMMTSLLYGVSPTDATTLAGVAALLVVVAGVASGVPAWRAARVDPLVALRHD